MPHQYAHTHTKRANSLTYIYAIPFPPSVFLGTKPSYYIADLDLCKEIFVKHFDKFVDRLVSSSVSKHFELVTSDFCLHWSTIYRCHWTSPWRIVHFALQTLTYVFAFLIAEARYGDTLVEVCNEVF